MGNVLNSVVASKNPKGCHSRPVLRFVPMDSKLNGEILTWIANSSLYDGVNLLEINLICSHGASMAVALGHSISSEDFQSCRTDCHLACQRHGACEQL